MLFSFLENLFNNWLDIIIVLIIFFYTLKGIKRGFVLGVIDLAGFIISFLIALRIYVIVGTFLYEYFSLSKGIANAVGFLFAGLMTEFIFTIIISVMIKHAFLFKAKRKSSLVSFFPKLDKWLGIIPPAVEITIILAFLLTIVISLPVQGKIKKTVLSSYFGSIVVSSTQNFERQINQIFGPAVFETLNFLTVAPDPLLKEKVVLGFTQKEYQVDQASEEMMLKLINNERQKNGLKQLEKNPQVQVVARKHAADMFVRGYFSHSNPENETPFDRLKKDEVFFLAAGENLAFAPSVELAHQGLLNSPGHRANILSRDFNQVGIGVIDGGIYGEMFVQVFTD